MFVAPWIPHQDFWHPLVKSFGQNMFVLSTFFLLSHLVVFGLILEPYHFCFTPFLDRFVQSSFCSEQPTKNTQNLSLSQAFSVFLPGTSSFFATSKPTSRNPGPSGPTLRRWRRTTRKSWGIPCLFFLWYRQCHKPTMTGDGGGFVKETLWLGIMIYDMGRTTLIYHKSIWKHMKAMKNQESVVFFSAYLLETREMGISSAKVEKYFFTMKHRDFTSKTLTRREKGWKRRCVARGLAVAYTVPQNAPKFFEGTWKNIQSLYFANTC